MKPWQPRGNFFLCSLDEQGDGSDRSTADVSGCKRKQVSLRVTARPPTVLALWVGDGGVHLRTLTDAKGGGTVNSKLQ